MSQYWSQRVRELDPYVPGEQPKDTQYIKLNTNENPYPPSPKVLAVLEQYPYRDLRLYPDPNSDRLKDQIAATYHVEKSQVFVGNGSDEVLAHAFVGLLKHPLPLLMPDISYSFYPVYSKLFGIEMDQVPLDDSFAIDINDYAKPNGGIIFPNPNAPTGIALPLEDIEALLKRNTESVVVVDEAYVDFGAKSAIALVNDYPNLLVIHTLSKSRSLAGLRVGYAIGDSALIEGLERVKNSFNSYPLGRMDIDAAAMALQDVEYFESVCEKIINTREATADMLSGLGFDVLPSKTNFVFAKPPVSHDAEQLYVSLKQAGILVRYFNAPRISGYLRITIGTEDEMSVFAERLRALMN